MRVEWGRYLPRTTLHFLSYQELVNLRIIVILLYLYTAQIQQSGENNRTATAYHSLVSMLSHSSMARVILAISICAIL